jgi:hypothetical protein
MREKPEQLARSSETTVSGETGEVLRLQVYERADHARDVISKSQGLLDGLRRLFGRDLDASVR